MYSEILIIVMNFYCAMLKTTFNCKLPFGCEINDVQFIIDYSGNEKTSMGFPGVLCDIRNETFRFDYPIPSPILKDWCHVSSNVKITYDIIEFRFPTNFILSKQFNYHEIFNYMWYFKYFVDFNFVSLKGFELDITNNQNLINRRFRNNHFLFQCIRCKIEFYSNGRHIKTCQDIIDSDPNGNISSLFQIQRPHFLTRIALFYPEFKTPLCPILFNNSDIFVIYVIGLVDTFYKRNTLTIENNRTFNNSNPVIYNLYIEKAEKINIDSNLLNPSVFQYLEKIYLSGSFNKIDGNSLNGLNNLYKIQIVKKNYRNIIHKNGIKWIRHLNRGFYVNLSDFEEIQDNYNYYKIEIQVGCFDSNAEIRLSKLFPDEDFCLYKDFPFNKLVILMEYANNDKIFELLNSNRHYTCSYLWLAQYFNLFIKLDK